MSIKTFFNIYPYVHIIHGFTFYPANLDLWVPDAKELKKVTDKNAFDDSMPELGRYTA